MSQNKIIAVLGATGAQGGGLVRAILNDQQGGFTARAITRNVNSNKAKALANMGAEVVQAASSTANMQQISFCSICIFIERNRNGNLASQ